MLAKKSPKDAVNEFKLKFINTVLSQCNSLFGKDNRPFADFETFAADSLPSNSDVTFILSQYIECAEKFRSDNIRIYSGVLVVEDSIERSDQLFVRRLRRRSLKGNCMSGPNPDQEFIIGGKGRSHDKFDASS